MVYHKLYYHQLTADGFTVGELSECAQEAINAPTKADVSRFRGLSTGLRTCKHLSETGCSVGLGEIIRADLNFTIKTCTVGIG